VALCLAQRLPAAVPDRELKGAMERLLRKFVDLRSDGSLSVIGDIFHAVAGALFRSVPHRRGDEPRVNCQVLLVGLRSPQAWG